ncbi:hypothetical protein Ddc_04732 [Ditylenchus destructor]|nr:hypothetical protein Ddc_04732 [Ditylenchus destructor]
MPHGGVDVLCNCQRLSDAQDEEALSQSSGRIINDILEIFVPAKDNEVKGESKLQPSLPYGFNRLLARGATDSDPVGGSRRRPLGDPIEITKAPSEVAGPWANLAKDVMGLFRPEISTTPKPTATTQASFIYGLYNQFAPQVPGFINPLLPAPANDDPPSTQSTPSFLGFTLPTFTPPTQTPPSHVLAPLFPFLVPTTTTPQPFLDRLTSLFKKNEQPQGPQLDTGNFDRLVIREKDNEPSGDLLAALVGDKWREKGVQWHNGNLRFVDKKGSNLMGSEVSVHDRSVDIPVQRWFDMANNFVSRNQNPYE